MHNLHTNALYMDRQDPQWRSTGVEGGSLLFDGSSTFISCDKSDLAVEAFFNGDKARLLSLLSREKT